MYAKLWEISNDAEDDNDGDDDVGVSLIWLTKDKLNKLKKFKMNVPSWLYCKLFLNNYIKYAK